MHHKLNRLNFCVNFCQNFIHLRQQTNLLKHSNTFSFSFTFCLIKHLCCLILSLISCCYLKNIQIMLEYINHTSKLHQYQISIYKSLNFVFKFLPNITAFFSYKVNVFLYCIHHIFLHLISIQKSNIIMPSFEFYKKIIRSKK